MLIAHPLLLQPVLNRALVLVCEHAPGSHSLGFVLNAPTGQRLRELLTGEAFVSHAYLKPFADAPVYKGGDVGEGTLFLLHRVPGLRGSVALGAGGDGGDGDGDGAGAPLFWSHDFEAAADAIGWGRASTSDFRVVLGYSGWGAQQLEGEVERVGSWFVARGERAVAELALGDTCARAAEGEAACSSAWSAALTALGGEHARLSRIVQCDERSEDEVVQELQQRALGPLPLSLLGANAESEDLVGAGR